MAVLVLLGSMLAGLRGSPARDLWSVSTAGVSGAGPGAVERIRVEVLNGAGVPGLARSVTERLRSLGFDVVYYGNASAPAGDSTVVLDRAGDAGAAGKVAAALNVGRIETALDTTLYLEATVILGSDWITLQESPR